MADDTPVMRAGLLLFFLPCLFWLSACDSVLIQSRPAPVVRGAVGTPPASAPAPVAQAAPGQGTQAAPPEHSRLTPAMAATAPTAEMPAAPAGRAASPFDTASHGAERASYKRADHTEYSPPLFSAASLPADCRAGGRWQWPAFGSSRLNSHSLFVYGRGRQAIYAAAPGTVIYSGDEPGRSGLGRKAVIIQHNPAYHSVYAHLRYVQVREGEQVAGGQRIAEMGIDLQRRPALKFEIRCHDKAVNPLAYLPAR